MPDLLKNTRTGEYGYRADSGEIIPAEVARSKQTGELGWRPKGSSEPWRPVGAGQQRQDFAARAAQMDPVDISVARSKNDAFGEFLRQQAMQTRPGETEQNRSTRLYGGSAYERPGQVETAARGALQGALFGFGDELVAAGAATLDQGMGGNFGDRYQAYLDRERARLQQGREDNPVTAYGSEIAGAVPTALIPALNVARGGNYARAIGTGALQGAVYGSGAAEGGAANRARGAATGAGVGGALGGASVPVAQGVGNLARALATNRAARNVGVSRPAYDVMQRVMRSDEALTGQGAKNIRAAGPRGMIADAGPSAAGLLDTAVQSGGAAARLGRQNVSRRVSAASRELAETLDNVLGNPQGVRASARDIAQRTSAGRSEAYERAYSSAIDYASPAGRRIEDVVSRVPARVLREAIETANDNMTSLGQRNQQIMARIADDGSAAFVEAPNVQQLDELKKALATMGRENVDQFGRQTGAGGMYSRLANELRDAIGEAAPSYKEAVRRGFDKIEMDNALKLGRNMLRTNSTREDVATALRGMSDAAKAEARLGLRSYIDDVTANVKSAMTDPNVDARETLKALKDFSSRASREKVQALLEPDEASRLYDVIERAERTFGVRARLAENSKTFARQETAKIVRGEAEGGPFEALRSAEPIEAAKSVARTALGRSEARKQRISDELYGELAQILTGPSGEDAASKLRLLARSTPMIERSGRRAGDLTQRLMTPAPAISGGLAPQLINDRRR
jgi:hypothetical protein